MPVVGRILVEPRDDHIRLKRAHDPDHVGERFVVAPRVQGLRRAFRIPEIPHPREPLLRSVETARGQKLFGPDDVQKFRLLAADEVLSSSSPRHREIGSRHMPRVRQVAQEARVLVVRMRGDVEHTGGDPDSVDRVGEVGCVHRNLLGGHRGGERQGKECKTKSAGHTASLGAAEWARR